MPDPGVTRAKPPRKELRQSVRTWEDLVAESRAIKARMDQIAPPPRRTPDPGDFDEYQRLERDLKAVISQRERERDEIIAIVKERPRLADEAVAWGFKQELLEGPYAGSTDPDRREGEGPYAGSTDPDRQENDAVEELAGSQGNDPTRTGDGGGDGSRPNPRGQAADNRLLGKQGKHYVIRRTPNGGYLAVYSFKVKGQVFKIAVQIPKSDLGKYGIKAGDGKLLTKAQLKNIENIGWADELAPYVRQGDGHMVKSLERYLSNQYGGNPMLKNDEVMGVVIENSLEGWTPGEFEQQLRNTKWYQNTNEYQRTYDTTMSDKERKEIQKSSLQKVVNALENTYGFDWMTKVDGGMQKAKKWAEQIASGKWGTPDEGLAFWAEKQFDKAVGIFGTPAWIARQKEEEDTRSYLNRPEDMEEQLRQDEIARFGRTIMGKKERLGWATDIVTEARPDSDWDQFMRRQMKTLYPYFDENLSFTEQASPFKAMLEQTLGTPVGWDHDLLMDFAATDDKGKPLGTAMSLYDYQLRVRDPDRNPAAYQQGTPLFDQGMDRLNDILGRLRGAA